MLETIIILVAGFWLYTKMTESKKSSTAPKTAPIGAPAQEPARVIRVLNIEGTQAFSGAPGFIRSFGLNPQELRDLKFVAGPATLEALAPRVQGCLQQCYVDGNTRGPEVPGLLHRQEALPEGQGLYFALLERPGAPPKVVTFVDKLRKSI